MLPWGVGSVNGLRLGGGVVRPPPPPCRPQPFLGVSGTPAWPARS